MEETHTIKTTFLREVLHGLLVVGLSALAVFLIAWLALARAEYENRPQPIEATIDGGFTLPAKEATITGEGSARFEQFSAHGNIGYWSDPSQSLTWLVQSAQSSKYRARIDYALPAGMQTSFKLVAGKHTLEATIHGKGNWGSWQTLEFGELTLPQGACTLQLLPTDIQQNEGVMNFVKIQLQPIQ